MSNFIKQQPLILASASKARFDLLHSLGLVFDVIPAHCDEEGLKKKFAASSFIKLAEELAEAKALIVSKQWPNHFVIAADQICIIGENYLDKPITHATATEHLRLLRGKKHQQLASWCVAKGGKILWREHAVAELTLRNLSEESIEAYLKAEQPYQSCGAYHFEGKAKWLFEEIKGHDSTILGLPVFPLMKALRELGVVDF